MTAPDETRMKPNLILATVLIALAPGKLHADGAREPCIPETPAVPATPLYDSLLASPDTVFPDLQAAVAAKLAARAPTKYIETGDKSMPRFPSYSSCTRTFFRVATIDKEVDQRISEEGWKSGWIRKEEQLNRLKLDPKAVHFEALDPNEPLEDRIIQYVRIKGVPSQFPKDSSIVGVLENPIRTLSVGYHTGFDAGVKGHHMRMDEIELGPCAKAPVCKTLKALDTTAVFAARKLTPRYSTEGEWAVDRQIPRECLIATYRIRFQKAGDQCYSDANKNCGFQK